MVLQIFILYAGNKFACPAISKTINRPVGLRNMACRIFQYNLPYSLSF